MSAAPVGAVGVDLAWAHPDPSKLHEWGYRFACRYFSHDPSKNLSAAEAKSLLAAQLDVVSNWESTADSALGGAAAGAADGAAAASQSTAVGAPERAAVFFSVDFDAQPNQYPVIAAYLDAARGKLGGRRVGVYGGKALVDYMVANAHADLGWQTLAWSYGQISEHAAIYQDQTGITLPDGSSADHNKILKAEYGGWLAPAVSPASYPAWLLAACGGDEVANCYQVPGRDAQWAVSSLGVKWHVPDLATRDKLVADGLLRLNKDGKPYPASDSFLNRFVNVPAPTA